MKLLLIAALGLAGCNNSVIPKMAHIGTVKYIKDEWQVIYANGERGPVHICDHNIVVDSGTFVTIEGKDQWLSYEDGFHCYKHL